MRPSPAAASAPSYQSGSGCGSEGGVEGGDSAAECAAHSRGDGSTSDGTGSDGDVRETRQGAGLSDAGKGDSSDEDEGHDDGNTMSAAILSSRETSGLTLKKRSGNVATHEGVTFTVDGGHIVFQRRETKQKTSMIRKCANRKNLKSGYRFVYKAGKRWQVRVKHLD